MRVHARGAVRRRARCAEQRAWGGVQCVRGMARVLAMGRQGKWRRWKAAEVLWLVARWDAWHSRPQERWGELRGRGVRAVGHVRVVVVGVHAVLLRRWLSEQTRWRERGTHGERVAACGERTVLRQVATGRVALAARTARLLALVLWKYMSAAAQRQ